MTAEVYLSKFRDIWLFVFLIIAFREKFNDDSSTNDEDDRFGLWNILNKVKLNESYSLYLIVFEGSFFGKENY